MSGDDQLPLEGLSNDSAVRKSAPPPPDAELLLAADRLEQRVRDAAPLSAGRIDAVAAPATGTALNAPPQNEGIGEHEVEATDPAALYFLTNRMNLNGVLGSRLIAPRESHGKYYVDLLEEVAGWVPLLSQPPTQALIEKVTAERGAGPAVLIEFPQSVVKKAKLKGSVIYVPALALAQAVAIHFRDEKDLREHRARGYKNIHPHDALLKVTPALFASNRSTEVVLAVPAEPNQVDWTRIDRIRGALNAGLAAVQNGEQLAIVAALFGQATFPAHVAIPDWISWREIDDHGSPGDRRAPALATPDHVGFRAVYEVLGEEEASEAWSPNAVLDEVASLIREAGLDSEVSDALIRNLQRVRSIVNVEVDFEPFRPGARGLVSAKALLLVLLRSELEQLLTWPEDQTGADDLTWVTAAVLAGRLRGLARESIALRSLVLDDLTAAWAVKVARGEASALGKVRFSASSRGTSLKLDGVELLTHDALLPDLVAKYKKVADSRKEAVRVAVSRAVGWPVTHRLTVPAGASITEDNGVLTVLTTGEVELNVSVDEDAFVSKLGALTGGDGRTALAAFDVRKK